MEDLSALRTGWHGEPDVACDTLDAQVRAKHELRVRDEHLGVEILTVTLEPRIVGDLEKNVDVTTRTAARPGISDTAQRHVLTCRDAGRNLHRQLFFAAQPSFTTTLLARGRHDLAFAVARRARRNRHELSEEGPLCAAHFAGPVARRAPLRLRARLGAAAVATVARIENLDIDLLIDARGDFGQRERDRDLDVGAAARSAAVARAAPEHLLEATEPAEVAHENAKRLRQIDVVESARAATQSGLAVTIVRRALLRIAQNIVRLRDLLEPLLGVFRAVVAVRMVGHRKFAIRLLDFVVRRRALHAEYCVIVRHFLWVQSSKSLRSCEAWLTSEMTLS